MRTRAKEKLCFSRKILPVGSICAEAHTFLSKEVVENCNEKCFRLHKCIYSAIYSLNTLANRSATFFLPFSLR